MKLAYLPIYVRDWRSDPKVALLPWVERALYLDMLMLSWELGPLPDDPRAILRAIGCDLDVESVTRLLAGFFRHGADGWTSKRLEQERERSERNVQHLKSISRKGVSARASGAHDSQTCGQPSGTPPGQPSGQPHGAPHGQPRAPEPEPEIEPFPSAQTPKPEDPPSLRSGGSAPRGAEKVLPGLGLAPPKGKSEPSQAQVDLLTVRPIWLDAWIAQFGNHYVGLDGGGRTTKARRAALRCMFKKLGRDEAEFRRLVEHFLIAPPFKHRENPDPIALQESFDSVRAGLNGTGAHRAPAETPLERRKREGLERMVAWAENPT